MRRRRYWLTEAAQTYRDRALCSIVQSTSLAPRDPIGWMLLVPLLVDANEPQLAQQAASFAVGAAPNDANAQVLLAATSQGVGDLASAEEWFERALPHLPDEERKRYEDITPLLPLWVAERFGAMDGPKQERFAQRFWAGADPDPVSTQNEAQHEREI